MPSPITSRPRVLPIGFVFCITLLPSSLLSTRPDESSGLRKGSAFAAWLEGAVAEGAEGTSHSGEGQETKAAIGGNAFSYNPCALALEPNLDCGGPTYQFKRRLGVGAYGEVFLAIDTANGHRNIAVKREDARRENKLAMESELQAELSHVEGVPKVYNRWRDDKYRYMATQLFDHTLKHAVNSLPDGRASFKAVSVIAVNMLKKLKAIHLRGIIHQDLKPENIMLLKARENEFFLIDFGLSEYWLTTQDAPRKYMPRLSGHIRGTVQFASIGAHLGTISPSDELESLGYVLLWTLLGGLPWSSIQSPDKQVLNQNLYTAKMETSIQDMLSPLPKEEASIFRQYFEEVRHKTYEDGLYPDYDALIELFQDCQKYMWPDATKESLAYVDWEPEENWAQ